MDMNDSKERIERERERESYSTAGLQYTITLSVWLYQYTILYYTILY